MAKKREPRVSQSNPLGRLLALWADATVIERELYGLPCAREADQACRDAVTEGPDGLRSGCASDPWEMWCGPCAAWWSQAKVCDHLQQCCRIQREMEDARVRGQPAGEDPKGIDLG